MIISLLKPRQQRKHFPHKTLGLLFLFLFCVNGTPSFLAIVARYFMSADFTSHCICLTSDTIPLCGPVNRVQSNHIKQVRGSLLSGLGIRFQNLNLLHFDQITGLKSLSIYLFLLAKLNLGLQMDHLHQRRFRRIYISTNPSSHNPQNLLLAQTNRPMKTPGRNF